MRLTPPPSLRATLTGLLVAIVVTACPGSGTSRSNGTVEAATETTTANFIGFNWPDKRDNFVDDQLLLSGLNANDEQATITAKTATIIAGFKAKGANTLRLPINPATVLQSYWSQYSSIIDQATNSDMKVILAYWEGASSMDGKVDGTGDDFWSMWDTVVAKYRDNPSIYFEVMNEPYGYTTANLKDLYVQWLARYSTLPRGRIVLGGAGYSEDVNVIAADPRFAGYLLSFHFYSWWRSYTTVAEWEVPIQTLIAPERTILTEFGVVLTGGDDFSTATATPNLSVAFMQGMTNALRAKGMGSIYWPGVRENDTYSMFNYNGNALTVVSESALQRVQYGWALP